jgi:pimeloyl-ACP methyl ester carboxylesterase
MPHVLSTDRVRDRFWQMIARPERVDPVLGDVAADEFLRNYRSRAARVAFYAAARNIYLEKPDGADGFWTRLPELKPPSLFIWGSDDPLVPARFSRPVATAVPHAAQIVLAECGHVPQIELPERTHQMLGDFIAAGGASALPAARRATGSA